MFYIPNEWLINKENNEKVRDILNKMNRDILIEGEEPIKEGIKELERLGEVVIIEKINDETIVFGA